MQKTETEVLNADWFRVARDPEIHECNAANDVSDSVFCAVDD